MPSYLCYRRDRGDSSFHRGRSTSSESHLTLSIFLASCSYSCEGLDRDSVLKPNIQLSHGVLRRYGHGKKCTVETMLRRYVVYFNGFFHLIPGKREKSVSVEINSQPCSLARAARCASVTRFATAWPSTNIFRKTIQCRSVG